MKCETIHILYRDIYRTNMFTVKYTCIHYKMINEINTEQ